MRAWIFYIMAIIMALYASSVRADDAPSEDYSAEDKKRDLDNAAKCKTLSDGFHVLEKGYACFTGDIDFETIKAPKAAIDKAKVHTLYVNSLGGEILSTMELGRSIDNQKIKLVLHQTCFSSCANYLAPSASDLVIQKATLYGLHGSVFRSDIDYANAFFDDDKFEIGSPKWFNALREEYAKYPEFYKNLTVKEGIYFADIGVSEQYVTRYFEINRNRKLYDNGKCGNIPPVSLMIGPKYIKSFYYGHLLEFDWDEEAIKANPLFKEIFQPKYSIVFDNSLFPTMTPERGEINPLECFTLK